MNQHKRNRLVAAGTVSVVLLLVVLVAIMIYQLVVIVQLRNRRQELIDEIEKNSTELENYEDLLDYYDNYDALYQLAVEYDIIK